MNLAAAETYFATRLHSEDWDKATADDKARALATAERYISALSPRLREDVTGEAITTAVYEQALWLLQTTSSLRKLDAKLARGLTSRTAGSANEQYQYQYIGGGTMPRGVAMAPEAMRILGEWFLTCRAGELR